MSTHTIEALDLVVLLIDANSKRGTPKHAKAVQRLKDAKEAWRDKFKPKPCPHCGKAACKETGQGERQGVRETSGLANYAKANRINWSAPKRCPLGRHIYVDGVCACGKLSRRKAKPRNAASAKP